MAEEASLRLNVRATPLAVAVAEFEALMRQPLPGYLIRRCCSAVADFRSLYEIETGRIGETLVCDVEPSALFLDLIRELRRTL